MKYKAEKVGPDWTERRYTVNETNLERAREIRSTYGLPFTANKIARIWKYYSGVNSAGWMIHTPYDVEEAFGVKLTKIK